jgi:nucleoside-diphosphate-sugar epimerase
VSRGSAISQADIAHVLNYTSELWGTLRGARLLVTGGSGFVGKWLLETLQAANTHHRLDARATVLTRNVARLRVNAPWIAEASGIELAQGDIRDFAFPAGSFSHLIHAAADMAIGAAPLHVHDVIVGGTRRVLEFAAERAIADILLISSGAVYGQQPTDLDRLGEDFLGAPSLSEPAAAYGQGKRDAEWLTHAFAAAYGLRCRIVRLFAFAGPYLPLNGAYAVTSFIGDFLAGRPISVAGDGTPLRSYLYAADMAIWLWTALLRGQPGLVCNVGGDEIISIADLAALIAGLSSPSLPVRIARPASPGLAASRYVPSIARARQELGVMPRVLLEDGLRRMIASQRSTATGKRYFA